MIQFYVIYILRIILILPSSLFWHLCFSGPTQQIPGLVWRKFGFHLERGQERGGALRTDTGQWMGTIRSRFSPKSSCSVESSQWWVAGTGVVVVSYWSSVVVLVFVLVNVVLWWWVVVVDCCCCSLCCSYSCSCSLSLSLVLVVLLDHP